MKKVFLFLMFFILLFSCSDFDMENGESVIMSKNNNSLSQNVQLSIGQAEAYANLFIKAFNVNDQPKENNISQGNHIILKSATIIQYTIKGRFMSR